MPIMKSTLYLPGEKLNNGNYPEVGAAADDIQELISFSMKVLTALSSYIDGTYDKIYVDMIAVADYIQKCRLICESLGNASNVCFDLLIELRGIQETLQTLVYINNRYGDQFIGAPVLSNA